MARRVGLHDLRHRLLDERLETREPVSVSGPKIVGKIHANHDTGRRRVYAHRIRDVVKELRTSIPLDVVRIEVTPTELNVDPELVACRAVENVLAVRDQGRPRDIPLE